MTSQGSGYTNLTVPAIHKDCSLEEPHIITLAMSLAGSCPENSMTDSKATVDT